MYHEFLLSEISVHESYKGGLKVGTFFVRGFQFARSGEIIPNISSIVLYYDIRLF